ncbi:MAG TPA: hypothetical protein VGD99_24465 [Anaerolineae bacterium]
MIVETQNWPGYSGSMVRSQAQQLYHEARMRGWWRWIGSLLTRRRTDLLTLAEVEATDTLRNSYDAGVQMVSLAQIRGGSSGRARDFDSVFCPRRNHIKGRWLRVAEATLAGIGLPVVELIRVGDVYFVTDGHHRISVARALGQQEIDAEVKVWEVKGNLPWEQPVLAPVRRDNLKKIAMHRGNSMNMKGENHVKSNSLA